MSTFLPLGDAVLSSGCGTPWQRQRLAEAQKTFPITGTAGEDERCFGGAVGLTQNLQQIRGGAPVRFAGGHCDEGRVVLEKVARRYCSKSKV